MPEDATIGIVTAITVELAAVRMVLDGAHRGHAEGDPNHYYFGSIPSTNPYVPHHVVVSRLVRDGTRDAAAGVIDLIRSFPSLRAVLMCGIAAGIPAAGTTLGDIVSATAGIVDYGHVRAVGDERVLRRAPGDVSATMLRADHRVADDELAGRRSWLPTLAALGQAGAAFRRPDPQGTPAVHRGAIGSGDVLLRDAALRDDLARRHRIIAFDMEAAGVATAAGLHSREWFMVRGVSDFADNHKDDRWQGYAAAAAASYLRALLGETAPQAQAVTPVRSGGPGRTAAVSRIVEALLASSHVRDEHDRRRLLEELPAHIRSGVAYSPTTRIHVISIVRTCQSFPDGRDALLDALSLLLGAETSAFSTLAEVIRDNWNHA